MTGAIELRDIHFAYAARAEVTIFDGFSLSIPAGKNTALVGESGSGAWLSAAPARPPPQDAR